MNYIKHLHDKGYSPRTREEKLSTIKRFTAWLHGQNSRIEQVSCNLVLQWIKELQHENVRQSTINKYLSSIKHYLNYLVSNGDIAYNPILSIKLQGIIRRQLHHLLSPDELEELYQSYHISQAPGGKPSSLGHHHYLARCRNKIILGLLIYQGISVHSLNKLKVTHINLIRGEITIPSSRRNNERTLKLQAHQVFELHEYLTQLLPQLKQRSGKVGDELFISSGKSGSIGYTITKFFNQLRALNSSLTSLYQLRASVISNWLKHYNLRQVQYMAGHRYVSSTERYQSHNIEQLQHIINKHILNPDC